MVGTNGIHYLVEFTGCQEDLDNISRIEEILFEAASKANTTIVTYAFHHFQPAGISGVVVIAESHISIHTWAEEKYAAVDIYTCGNKALPERAVEYLIEQLKPSKVFATIVERGLYHQNFNEYFHYIKRKSDELKRDEKT